MGEERLTLVDFNEAQRVIKGYGGDAGRKAAMLWEGSLWMVKFPESMAGMRGNILSYTTSPVAEYIGSHVFEQIGVPVHRDGTRHPRGEGRGGLSRPRVGEFQAPRDVSWHQERRRLGSPAS